MRVSQLSAEYSIEHQIAFNTISEDQELRQDGWIRVTNRIPGSYLGQRPLLLKLLEAVLDDVFHIVLASLKPAQHVEHGVVRQLER